MKNIIEEEKCLIVEHDFFLENSSHGTAPKYLSELISFKSNSHYGLRSNKQQLLSPPKVKTLATLGDRAFVAAASKLWSSLAPSLRDISNYELFKQKLKTFLFRQAF